MGVIYIIKNRINNKCYIGQTKYTAEKRFKEHIISANSKSNHGKCTALVNAMKCHGIQNFYIETLHDIKNGNIDELETKCINDYNSLCPNGYNIQTGGKTSGQKHCEESRERMRQAKLGDKNPNYGKERSPITKLRISDAKKGEKHHFFGKTFTNEHKLNLSKAHKNDDLPMYMVHLDARPHYYQAEGYVIINHPKSKPKYFTSKKLSMKQKYNLAFSYLTKLNHL